MKRKTTLSSFQRLFSILLFLGLMISPWGGNQAPAVRAYTAEDGSASATAEGLSLQQGYVIRTGNYQVPDALLAALRTELAEIAQESGGATEFGVGYYEEGPHWAWIDLLVANGSYFKEEELGPSFLYFAVKSPEAWNVVLARHDQEYRSLLDAIPREGLRAGELQRLEQYYRFNRTEPDVNVLAGALLFPWQSSQNPWRFASNGFHPSGFQSLGMEPGAEAIDLVPPSSAQPARVLAMESGTVTRKLECLWNTVLIVRHDGYSDPKRFLYLHLQNGTSAVGVGTVISRGQYLGDLRTPVFNGYWSNGVCSSQGSGAFNCERDVNPATGNLCSSSTARHLHLGFGTDRNIVMDGHVVAILNPGSSYNSTNTTGSVCLPPALNSPADGYIAGSQTISFNWSALSGCTFNGYTFRIKDTPNMDSGGTVVDDRGVGGTSTPATIDSQWNDRDLYWGVRAANAPNGASWAVRRFRIQPGSQTGQWSASFYDTTDRWVDPNNASNFKCSQTINGATLDQSYGAGAPCNGMDGDSWVGDYSGTFHFPSGAYVFQVEHDDGLKLWLNNQNIAERGSSGASWVCPPRELSGDINLRLLLREDGGNARVKVMWTTDTSGCTPAAPLLTLHMGEMIKNRQVSIELLNQAGVSVFVDSAQADANGDINNLSLPGVPPGTYNLLVKPRGWLRKARQVALVSGPNDPLDLQFDGSCNCAGDILEDNRVDILDFQLLSNDFGKTTSSPADLNGDHRVDILDFQLLSNGFGQVGAGNDLDPAAQGTIELATLTGSMTSPRWYQTGTRLPDGKVLASGGYNTSALKSAELYNPPIGNWTATSSMSAARQVHTATLLPNGKVLVSGGLNASWTSLDTAELYNPATGSWTNTGSMSGVRFGHTATLLPNGKVLVAGGTGNLGAGSLASAELYDPATNTWTPTDSLTTARASHTATLLPNGKVLVTGGLGANSQSVAASELYDPATVQWSSTDALHTERYGHTATLLTNGKVLVVGGGNEAQAALASAELYGPAIGAWTETGSVAIGRQTHAAALLLNGKVWVSGGANPDQGGYLASVALYTPGSGTWAATTRLAVARSDHPAVLLLNGKVLSMGGKSASGVLASAELYTPPKPVTFKSAGAQDGWVLETSENSNQGGAINAATATFILGDNAGNRQYRSILHFNTASLPDNAVITKVLLKIKKQSVAGTNPFSTHLKIAVDIRKGAFSNAGALQATDFQAPANKPAVGLIANNPQAGGWYVSNLKPVAYPFINRTGITQFRLRFQTDDDNDAVADLIRFYSGDAIAANRPVLVIEYYVP